MRRYDLSIATAQPETAEEAVRNAAQVSTLRSRERAPMARTLKLAWRLAFLG
jgi:hypothetical protein